MILITVSFALDPFVSAFDPPASDANSKEVISSDFGQKPLDLENLDGPFCQCIGEGAFHELKLTSVDLVEASL